MKVILSSAMLLLSFAAYSATDVCSGQSDAWKYLPSELSIRCDQIINGNLSKAKSTVLHLDMTLTLDQMVLCKSGQVAQYSEKFYQTRENSFPETSLDITVFYPKNRFQVKGFFGPMEAPMWNWAEYDHQIKIVNDHLSDAPVTVNVYDKRTNQLRITHKKRNKIAGKTTYADVLLQCR